MKKLTLIISFLTFFVVLTSAQNTTPDFVWGNVSYYNLNIGERIQYQEKNIKLLSIENLCNTVSIDDDIIELKISQRSLPENINGLKIFVADNRNLRSLDESNLHHALLNKDALIAVSSISTSMLNKNSYVFPVSFNEGFTWNLETDKYLFSAVQKNKGNPEYELNNAIEFHLQDDNGIAKHWMVAIENSKVVWIESSDRDDDNATASVLLESESQPGIFYFYGDLHKRSLEVREGQKIIKGELIGTAANGKNQGEAKFAVLKNDSIPGINDVEKRVVNFFPQLFELYFNMSFSFSKMFTKGNIFLGNTYLKNEKNNLGYESYNGKGWLLGCRNITGSVPVTEKAGASNVRIQKILFEGTKAESENPLDYYDYEINVNNGAYHIRAKVGDAERATWQKVEFENRNAGEYSLKAGELVWTPERIVDVIDGKITVRIFVDSDNKPAGISEIVFQKM